MNKDKVYSFCRSLKENHIFVLNDLLQKVSDTLNGLSFQLNWRDYQQKFLKDFQNHIKDDHLHVVAPPGSGKTILGIEMTRRLKNKAIILSPTLTIRNQWV